MLTWVEFVADTWACYNINKNNQYWHASSRTKHNVASHLPLYFYYLRNPKKSWYNVLLCLSRDGQDVEFVVQNVTKVIMIKISSKQTS